VTELQLKEKSVAVAIAATVAVLCDERFQNRQDFFLLTAWQLGYRLE